MSSEVSSGEILRKDHEKHILTKSGIINEYLHHVDLEQYGQARITSSFLYWDGDVGVIMDCGTSDDVGKLLRYLKRNNIPLDKIVGICASHYHFDHMGGATTLWKRISRKNPDFKIFVPKDTMGFLQDSEMHLKGARTTFGEFVGKMPPAPEDAYQVIEKNECLPVDLASGYGLKILSTPGHSPDHCSPVLIKDDKVKFLFTGEACGSLFHSTKIVSIPTSMPPNFNYEIYHKNLDLFLSLNPEMIGFCHFGAIQGNNAIKLFINDHKKHLIEFRKAILDAYKEEPSTRHVLKKTIHSWKGRFDDTLEGDILTGEFLGRLRLALTYGQMIDLGLRKPKYEPKS